MTETEFIEKNRGDWEELETLLSKADKDPDQLRRTFVKVSSDLAYARTFFGNRSVRVYLNNLTQQVMDEIRSMGSTSPFRSFMTFFTETLPLAVWNSRKAFYVSLLLFLVSFTIGVVSTIHDPEFTRDLLGDQYVDMTEENIDKNDPLAVYKGSDMLGMTLAITINNIRVAFMAFVLGLFGGIGTIYILVYNGIMVGTFQYFFIGKGLFLSSFLTIWIHGTIEIAAIIIAGAAGLTLGGGILFPGTYSRYVSIRTAAKEAIVIISGTIPLFIIAGLLESFVTRETGLPNSARGAIILFSFSFICFMWMYLPWKISRRMRRVVTDKNIPHIASTMRAFELKSYRPLIQSLNVAISQWSAFIGQYLKFVMFPSIIGASIIFWYRLKVHEMNRYDVDEVVQPLFASSVGGVGVILLYVLAISSAISLAFILSDQKPGKLKKALVFLKFHYYKIFLLTGILIAPLVFIDLFWLKLLYLGIVNPLVLIVATEKMMSSGFLAALGSSISEVYGNFFNYLGLFTIFLGLGLIMYLTLNSPLIGILSEFFGWHEIFAYESSDRLFIAELISFIGYLLIVPLLYYLGRNVYWSEKSKIEAIDMNRRLEHFGISNSILEERKHV